MASFTKNEKGEFVPMSEAEIQAFNESVDAYYNRKIEEQKPEIYHLEFRISQAKKHQHFDDAEQLESELAILKNK
jgi:hypothetical protein